MANNLTFAPFWFVWSDGGGVPTHKHRTEESAVAESERLARAHPGQTFIVLESVCARRIDDMLRIGLRPDCDIPF